MLSWCNQFNICSFLDNHHYFSTHQNIECLAAAGSIQTLPPEASLQDLDQMIELHKDWLFGHIGYDIKETPKNTPYEIADSIGFPDLFFFRPQTVLSLTTTELTISTIGNDPRVIYQEIKHQTPIAQPLLGQIKQTPTIQSRLTKEEYLDIIQKIQQHIQRGDCYELNYCQEFYVRNASIHPFTLYQQLTSLSPNPFSAFYKLTDKYVLCASPERYLQKKGNRLISQPIKGTAKRDLSDAFADEQLKKQLQISEKEKSENVMVVDLVRNDLSKVCEEGSVQVDELFGVYSFPQVHQMISTISGNVKPGIRFSDIIDASFPMGSMTGAPKKRVMELIRQYEKTKRGIYSGALGYIRPDMDFDFNVVIRSILYNASNQYLSYLVGGGITFYSDAEKEYEECLLKAKAIHQVLRNS